MDNLFPLQTAIHLLLRQEGGKTSALFVDVRPAFNSAPQIKLWAKLRRFGISSKFIRIIKILYDHAILQIKTSSGLSNSVVVSEGVLQGEVLSFLLFIIYLSDMTSFFGLDINNMYDLIMLLYADDLIILAHSPPDLKRKILTLDSCCDINSLMVQIKQK